MLHAACTDADATALCGCAQLLPTRRIAVFTVMQCMRQRLTELLLLLSGSSSRCLLKSIEVLHITYVHSSHVKADVAGLKMVVMVALCNSADCGLPGRFYLSFFPRLISAVGDWMSTILPHMVWP